MAPSADTPLPYKIAVLVYIRNTAGEVLLLHRGKEPNFGLYSPIGGKLEQAIGESPVACAQREAHEEIGIDLPLTDFRLSGIVSETAYNGQTHWLMFCYEVLRPLDFPPRTMNEGRLEWIALADIIRLTLPDSDRQVIWPQLRKHARIFGGDGEVFTVHLDCRTQPMQWTVQQP
ncbi:MAG: NUDIX domain-containing protein [Phycisphaerae bacterium]